MMIQPADDEDEDETEDDDETDNDEKDKNAEKNRNARNLWKNGIGKVKFTTTLMLLCIYRLWKMSEKKQL